MSVFRFPIHAPETARAKQRRRDVPRAGRVVRGPGLGTGLAMSLCMSLGLAILIGGCAVAPSKTSADASSQPIVAADLMPTSVHGLLLYAQRLEKTNPQGRADAVRSARDQVQRTPGPLTNAHLALALAAPHQPLYTPDEAARYARLALDAQPSPWQPDAAAYLSQLAQWAGQSASLESQNDLRIQQLQSQLDRAHAKLNALSNIEQQIDHNTRP